MRLVDSLRRDTKFCVFASPWSKIISKRKGFSGWTLIPLSKGGLKGRLKCTMTPGAGRRKSCALASGRGPKVLTRKVISINKWANGFCFIIYNEPLLKCQQSPLYISIQYLYRQTQPGRGIKKRPILTHWSPLYELEPVF